jgi:hypothetical protein
MGDFGQSDYGRDPFDVTNLDPLEKFGTGGSQPAAREVVDEDVRINENAATRR